MKDKKKNCFCWAAGCGDGGGGVKKTPSSHPTFQKKGSEY